MRYCIVLVRSSNSLSDDLFPSSNYSSLFGYYDSFDDLVSILNSYRNCGPGDVFLHVHKIN